MKSISNIKENNTKLFTIVLAILISFVGNIVILILLPKMIAFSLSYAGITLDNSNQMTKYLMGIFVRIIGVILFMFVMIKLKLMRIYHFKLNKRYILLSWLFFIYIIFNMEFTTIKDIEALLITAMIIDSLAIGLYEEIVFRGVVLPLLLKKWGTKRKSVVFSVVGASALFGLLHLTNILTGAPAMVVVTQVIYATIMGIAFSALLLRTNWNLVWCGLIHGMYDMSSGFGDFNKSVSTVVSENVDILPHFINLLLFLPLLLYALFLLRKIKCISADYSIQLQPRC